jgi:tripartite ATP-independent transporter DctM subunit
MNGLSVAGMAIGCTIALPEMLKRGYDKRLIIGVIQGGSSLGILIPPSVVLVLYALIARQPVTDLWLAGILPGLLMAGMFAIYALAVAGLDPAKGPPLPPEERAQVSRGEKLRLLSAGLMPLFIFAVMMLPFLYGYVRLVESSVIGAAAAVLVAGLKGRLSWALIESCTKNTLLISCMFLWIILAALAFGAVFDGLRAVEAVEFLFTEQMGLGPWTILILMQASFLIMGMFLDDTAMLVIVAPLYVPLVGQLDLGVENPLVWYGILYTITCQIAYLTPPFGYNLFLMRAMAGDRVSLAEIYVAIIPIVLVMIATLGVLMLFPEIATWLPAQFAK